MSLFSDIAAKGSEKPCVGVVTCAEKVTVSVLYWYEKLPIHFGFHFWKNPGAKAPGILFDLHSYSVACLLNILAKFSLRSDQKTANLAQRSENHGFALSRHELLTQHFVTFHTLLWVRPYYAECTTSRLICEVKQRQAQLVLR